MKIISTTLLLSVLLPTFCLAGHTATDFDIQWIRDQHVIGVNREAGHATLIPYSSKAALLADEYHKRPWVTPTKAMTLDLNGKWRFRYVPGSNQGPGASKFQAEDYNDERWPLITVPMNWKPTFIPFAKARKRVETLFSQLTDQFLVIRNYAKETCGLFARIVGKVSAMTALQYINYINNKPIGRIKCAMS